jgi:hypothetical protein
MLKEFVCIKCRESSFVFESEVDKRLKKDGCINGLHDYLKLPPIPFVVHCTSRFFHQPLLDSWTERRIANMKFNLEANQEREAKAYQDFVNKL